MELTASAWAQQQWGSCRFGDRRLTTRAVHLGQGMAAHPDGSLPKQMGDRTALVGAYRLLNNPRVTAAELWRPHQVATRTAAEQTPVVLFVQDWTTLDYTAHAATQGIGPVGSRQQQGMLLHSVLAVTPTERQVLGWAYGEVRIRPGQPRGRRQRGRQPETEADAWERAVVAIGPAPAGVLWVHVSDRESDIYEYWQACRRLGNGFVVRARQNRCLWDEARGRASTEHLLAHVRAWPAATDPATRYAVAVPATRTTPARSATVCLAWGHVTLAPPAYVRPQNPLRVWMVRAWEPDPPPGSERVEWLLATSQVVETPAMAQQIVAWYMCRWLVEDFHQCLKTGCRIEHSQLDHADDLQRLLGFAVPIAVRLLQLRQAVRATPDQSAQTQVDPLTVELLARHFQVAAVTLTVHDFWRLVARLGGHPGRKSDGPPGWRTLWYGWQRLSDWLTGARLAAP